MLNTTDISYYVFFNVPTIIFLHIYCSYLRKILWKIKDN